MALRLANQWLWDFWTIADGAYHHLFYLQAPRSLGDPDRRHRNATIGHAVSTDLTSWEVLPGALVPGEAGEWDDYTTWTGSVIRCGDRWAMLYTGTSHGDDGLIQRIGLAWSDDLIHWSKDPANPVLQLDAARYEKLDLAAWHEQAWRDPWLFVDPADGRFHVYLTSRIATGPSEERGVIAHAVSDDLRHWHVLAPVTSPGVYGHMEIPQLVGERGQWYLIFSTPGNAEPSSLIGRDAMLTGTHYLSSSRPTGPFTWDSHGVLLADRTGSWYGCKLVQTSPVDWVALAWDNAVAGGGFGGTLSDPIPINWSQGPSLETDPQ